MIFQELSLPGAYLIRLELREDERGFFARAFCQKELSSLGLHSHFVQNNISYNKNKGTVRGMHFQEAPYEEVKIVRCTRGAIYDVIIDLRPASPYHKKWVGVELNASDGTMIYIPKGFAHGFQTLQDESEVFYWVSDYYSPSSAKGYCWNDPAFNVLWPLPIAMISRQDQTFSRFVELLPEGKIYREPSGFVNLEGHQSGSDLNHSEALQNSQNLTVRGIDRSLDPVLNDRDCAEQSVQ